jgi:O-antigen/teichoic acid export membrane protein
MTLSRTSLFHFFTQVITSVAGFSSTFVIARYLGADTLGIFVQATALITLITIPIKSLTDAANKRISEQKDTSEYFTACVVLLFGFVVTTAALMWLGKVYLVAYLGAPVGGLIILYMILNSVFSLYTSVLIGEKKVISSGILNAVEQGTRFLFQFTFILLGYALVGLFFGQILSFISATLVGLYISDLTVRIPARVHFRRLLNFAKYIWVNQIRGRSFSWMDVLILGALVESSYVGIYEVSWTLASVLILVSLSVQQTLFPELSELSVDQEYDQVRHFLDEGLVFVGIFAIPGLFGSVVLGGDLLTIYRPVFSQGQPVLILLILARLLDAYASQLISALSAIDYPEYVFRVGVVFTIVNVGLNILLIWHFDWVGAAVATCIAALTELVLSYIYLSRIIEMIKIPTRTIGAEIVSGLIMSGILIILTRYVSVTNYTVIGLVLFGATIYFSILLGASSRVRQKVIGLINVK